MKTDAMKLTERSALIALSLALFAVSTLSGCTSTSRSTNATHDMGSPKSSSQMSDAAMSGR